MNLLIPVINKLHDVFSCLDKEIIKLPQIVVIGSQSAGKSSVLENIVGHDFLPRGSGIVTRCPLILQLIHITYADPSFQIPYGKFLHTKDKIFHDFEEIKSEIVRKTDEIAGNGKCISDDAIYLKVFSQDVVNLTLVDLPGITKIPIQDQPDDIEEQITELCTKYAKDPNSIILSVTAANNDIVNSESLKLARKLDPEGERSLCILTKLDLMDDGTDAKDVLTGNLNIRDFKLGVIGVVNRSQADINNKKPIKDALVSEEEFFRKHYATLASLNGTSYLSRRLSDLLIRHIKQSLPQLKTEINVKLKQCKMELDSYGEEIVHKKETVMKMITNFSKAYCDTIDGNSKNINTNELCGGARIGYIFYTIFENTIKEIDSLGNLTPERILTAIQNATGPRASLFVPELTFELLIKNQITCLEEPSLMCVDLVLDEMQRIIQTCGTQKELMRFPKFNEKIVNVVNTLLRESHQPTNEMVKNLIKIELAFINNKHPDFDTSGAYGEYEKSLRNHKKNDFKGDGIIYKKDRVYDMNDKDSKDCQLIEHLIQNYFNIVRKNIKDLVPKTIMCFLVNHIKDNLQGKLVLEILQDPDSESLLEENRDFSERRKELKKTIDVLQKASLIIGEIRETQIN